LHPYRSDHPKKIESQLNGLIPSLLKYHQTEISKIKFIDKDDDFFSFVLKTNKLKNST